MYWISKPVEFDGIKIRAVPMLSYLRIVGLQGGIGDLRPE